MPGKGGVSLGLACCLVAGNPALYLQEAPRCWGRGLEGSSSEQSSVQQAGWITWSLSPLGIGIARGG